MKCASCYDAQKTITVAHREFAVTRLTWANAVSASRLLLIAPCAYAISFGRWQMADKGEPNVCEDSIRLLSRIVPNLVEGDRRMYATGFQQELINICTFLVSSMRPAY